MATLSDVAAKAGVSKMAASVVLNGSRSGTRVSEATRQRIIAVAEEIGYRPNAVARSLKGGHTNVIGFYRYYAHGRLSAFHAEVMNGLEEGCNAHHRDLLLYGTFQGRSSAKVYSGLNDQRIDGLVILAFAEDPLVPMLCASALPVVAIVDAIPGLPSVIIDDAEGGRLQARYLYAKGHRSVLYITLAVAPISVKRRWEAFCEEASALGITVHVVTRQRSSAPATLDWEIPDWHAEDIQSLWHQPGALPPTAVVCWSDEVAYRLMDLWQQSGIRFPRDLALMGFDCVWKQQLPFERLTTIAAPWQQVAETAITLLTERIAGKEVPLETILPVTLMEGETA